MRRCADRGSIYPPSLIASLVLALPGVLLCGEQPVLAQSAQAAPQAAPAPPPVVPPVSGPVIAEIIVTGNRAFNEEAIISFSGHKVGDACTDQVLAEIRTNLSQSGFFGTKELFFNPEAVQVRAEDIDANRCKVVISVEENPIVENYQITGSGPIKVEEIQALFKKTKENKEVFNLNKFELSIRDLLNLYGSRGYIVALDSSTGFDTQNPGVLNIAIIVTRVGEVKIANNRKTNSKVILREMKTKLGDYFNRAQLNEDKRRLLNLDLFDDVSLGERDLGVPGKIGLTINVAEKRTGQVLAGVGFSNRQQLIGFAQIAETNFRGLGDTVNLRWETGGVTSRNTIELGFIRPWLDKRHTSLAVQLYDRVLVRFSQNLQNDVSGNGNVVDPNDERYNERRTGATVTLGRPFKGDTYRANLSLRGESVRTDALNLSDTNKIILQNGPLVSLGGRLVHDTRDLFLDPVSGTLQQVSMDVGYADLRPAASLDPAKIPPGVFGKTTFLRSDLDLRLFVSPTGPRDKRKPDQEKSTVAMRLQVGVSNGNLPYFEQFFVGGAESLRGYREDRFWGSYRLLGSVEFRQPLARSLKGVLFMDVGSAWGGAYRNVDLQGFKQSGFSPHVGVGLGIRVRTPIGPLRLDYGIGDEGGRTHFSIGNVF